MKLKMRKTGLLIITTILLGIGCDSEDTLNENVCSGSSDIQYLGFQLFVTGNTEPMGEYQALPPFISRAQIEDFFEAIQSKVGDSYVSCRRTAIIIGPIALDFSNSDVSNLIDLSFELAIKYDIAVGFHIDDGMFWANRTDLWQNPENIEWIDWNETPNTSRYVDWVGGRLAPMMCLNAPEVKAAEKDFMSNISESIKSNLDELGPDMEYLYAGTIVGWEPSLDKDRDTQKSSGYHALSNRGFSPSNLPEDIDQERIEILQEYIEWMAEPLLNVGLPVGKTYAHIAFLSKAYYDYAITVNPDFGKQSYKELNSFSVAEVAIGKNYTPGFSTYPQAPPAKLFNEIYDVVGNATWASAEGANIIPSNPPISPGYNMESYLARHFNYGCTLLNVFAFNLRGDPFTDAINDASEGSDAIAAYKIFLSGANLTE
jgi:hypothetical protein